MMGRGLWFAAGAGAGAYVVVRARRAAEILTVDGLRDRVGAAVVGVRMFRDEVAQGKADAETGLRERMGLALHEHRELTAAPDTDSTPDSSLDSTRPDQITGGDSTTEQEVGRS